jgi:hypothetical protein
MPRQAERHDPNALVIVTTAWMLLLIFGWTG